MTRRSSVFWCVLLVAGQAASLVLTAAGPAVGYQHYRWPATPAGWAALGVLVVQAALVLAALAHEWRAIGPSFLARVTPLWRGVLLLTFVGTSATASREVLVWIGELGAATAIQAIALGNVWLAVRDLDTRGIDRWLEASEARSQWRDVEAWRNAAFVLVVSAVFAWFSYERHPHVPDEVAYLLQARYFADGMLWMPAPPAPLAFNLDLMHYEATRWYTPTPPGWPAVLALGVLAGVPWLVNPVLGAVNVLLAHRVLGSMYDRRTARLATLLLSTSPWFVFMSMNFMTHQATLCLGLLAAVAVARIREDRVRDGHVRGMSLVTACLGGLAIGGASIVRPLEGLAMALLLGLWSLPPRWWQAWRTPMAFAGSALLTLGTVASGVLVRPYNRAMTGDPSYFPIMAYIDKYYTPGANDLGFGANRGLGWSGLDPFPGHGLLDVVVNAALNVAAINTEWLGWAIGSAAILLVPAALRRLTRPDWWQVAVWVMVVGLHSFYWFSGGPDFGARYWFLVIVSCAALSARALLALDEGRGHRAVAGGLVLVVATWLTFIPWRATDKYTHYRRMRPDIRQIAATQPFGRSLVLIRGRRHPDYASAAAYNPLDLVHGTTLYGWDATPEARAQALAVYADRPVWFVDGPTVTGDGFKVVAGPMSAIEAAAYPRLPAR